MKAYAWNKIISLATVFSFIAGTYLYFGFNPTQWVVILLAIVVFGYAHFFLGFYYQLKSFKRDPKPHIRYMSFGILTILSIIVALATMWVFNFVTALFIGFVYFLFHGLLNEHTLIKRQSGYSIPLTHLVALAVFVMTLLAYTVPDKTFFFDHTLTFSYLDTRTLAAAFNAYYIPLAWFPYIYLIGTGSAAAVLLLSWYRNRYTKSAITIGILMAITTSLVIIFGAPPYIFMYVIVVGYHFMTWLLFYIAEMYARSGTAAYTFFIQNSVIFGVLLLAAFLFFNQPDPALLLAIVFDYRLYVILTYIHISTSFMNDDWYKTLEQTIAARVTEIK